MKHNRVHLHRRSEHDRPQRSRGLRHLDRCGVLRGVKTEDPLQRLAGLEEEEAVALAKRHNMEWTPSSVYHFGTLGLCGYTP